MNELVKKYLKHAKRRYRKRGEPTSELRGHRKALEHALAVIIRPDELEADRPTTGTYDGLPGRAIRDLPPDQLRADDFRAIVEHFATLRGRGKDADGKPNPITVGTANKYRRVVIGMVRWGAKQRPALVDESVADEAAKAERVINGATDARSTGKVPPVADEVIDGVVAFCRRRAEAWRGGSPNQVRRWRSWRLLAIAIELARQTGCRPGELVQLRLCDVSERGGVHVFEPRSHKTEHHDEERRVFLCDRACELIDEAATTNRTDGGQEVFGFAQDFTDRSPLFPWRGKHAAGSFTKAFQRALREAGLPNATGNQLRHTFISWGVLINPELTRRAAGHRNLATTMLYVPDDIDEVGHLWDQAGPGSPEPTPPRRTGTDDLDADAPAPLKLADYSK